MAGVPAGLEAVCLRCLVKEPGGRYGSAGEVADELGRWRALGRVETPLTPPASPRRGLTRRGALVAAGSLAAGAAGWLAPGGVLLVETSPSQSALTIAAMEAAGLVADVEVDDEVGGCVAVGVSPAAGEPA